VTHQVIAVGMPQTFRGILARALETKQEEIGWVPSVTAAEEVLGRGHGTVDVLVLSPEVKEPDAIGLAEFVARSSPMTAVVVVGDHLSNGSLPTLIRAGVRDVVDPSRGAEDLRDALRRAIDWSAGLRAASGDGASPPAERRGYVVSIFSTKGGTGKTFFACNLAAALAARSSRRTALLDLDLSLGDVFAYFGAEPKRSLKDLVAVEGSDGSDVSELGTPLEGGVTGFGSPPDPGAGPIGSEAMGMVLRALRSSFAYTVVDATSDFSDHVLAAFDLSDMICLMTGLDVIGVRHMSLGMQTLENLGVPKELFQIVLNRANSKVELTPGDIERVLRTKVDAKIPSSALVPRSINRSRLVWLDEPKSPVAKSITEFADKILAQTRQAPLTLAGATAKRAWRR
jgi:pilus assembly protein CpaE